MTTVSYVVVAFGSAAALRDSLPALARELRDGDELVLVDNASPDDSAAVTRELVPGARVVDGGGNLGFAGGANLGAQHATGELLVFLNPDATVAPGFAQAIRLPHEAGRGWTAWMGLVTSDGGTRVNTSGNVVHYTGIAWAGRAGAEIEPQDLAAREVPFLSGACLAIERAGWERLGGFPERYFMYQEDLDLCLRIRLGGGRVGIEPSARVEHDYEFEKGADKWRYLERNRLAVIVRTYPAPLLALVLPVLVVTEMALVPVSLAGGWGAAKLRADLEWLRALPSLLGERRAIQSRRQIGAGEFARWLTPDLSSPYLGALARSALVRLPLRAYWHVVRLLLGAR